MAAEQTDAFYRLKPGQRLEGLESGKCYEASKLPRHEIRQGIVHLSDQDGTSVGEYPLYFLEPCPEPTLRSGESA